jgi:hypothetical protein
MKGKAGQKHTGRVAIFQLLEPQLPLHPMLLLAKSATFLLPIMFPAVHQNSNSATVSLENQSPLTSSSVQKPKGGLTVCRQTTRHQLPSLQPGISRHGNGGRVRSDYK